MCRLIIKGTGCSPRGAADLAILNGTDRDVDARCPIAISGPVILHYVDVGTIRDDRELSDEN